MLTTLYMYDHFSHGIHLFQCSIIGTDGGLHRLHPGILINFLYCQCRNSTNGNGLGNELSMPTCCNLSPLNKDYILPGNQHHSIPIYLVFTLFSNNQQSTFLSQSLPTEYRSITIYQMFTLFSSNQQNTILSQSIFMFTLLSSNKKSSIMSQGYVTHLAIQSLFCGLLYPIPDIYMYRVKHY